jgi:hypothetical protein
VNFLFEQGGNWQLAGSASAASNPDVYAFLASVVGLRVGLETDSGGGFNNSPFSFGYFQTNLTVAQIEDDFAGGFNPSIPWTWNVPGNAPADTDDPTHYTFSPNSLDITVQPGSLYENNNSAHNIPSLLIVDQPPYWYVETAVRTDWSMASTNVYIHAGLIFFFDADNYYSFYNNRDAANAPSVQVSTAWETGGSSQYGGISYTDWAPTTDYVKLRVQGTPTQITFLFDHTGTWQTAGSLTSTNQPDVFALMSSLVGVQVGLEADSGGGTNTSPFSFGYFKTNLGVGP